MLTTMMTYITRRYLRKVKYTFITCYMFVLYVGVKLCFRRSRLIQVAVALACGKFSTPESRSLPDRSNINAGGLLPPVAFVCYLRVATVTLAWECGKSLTRGEIQLSPELNRRPPSTRDRGAPIRSWNSPGLEWQLDRRRLLPSHQITLNGRMADKMKTVLESVIILERVRFPCKMKNGENCMKHGRQSKNLK